jgi:beta-galactosidase
MAEREVSDAKELGLNCLQFHRNIGKPEVLDIQDREGLLRYEEPGGGKFAFGARYARGPFGPDGNMPRRRGGDLSPKRGYIQPDSVDTSGSGTNGDGQLFWEKYEEEKILEMVKRDRSHPSLVIYSMQNEDNDIDLRNPRIYRIFREIHALDPSRVIVLFSGGVPRDNEVLMLPYSDQISYGSKSGSKNIPYAGWRDLHTCGGPCNYLDNLYTDPMHFFQRSNPEDHKEICMWGEMLGAAVPDDYDNLVHSFDAAHPTGYELDDMTKILDGYHQFLDKWGFRQAFPTDSSLFKAIGYREYYFWQRIIEQSRADNANDYLVISGWESTTIDNHSGLVDNHRFFKGDPSVLAKACQPEVLFIQPRHMIVAKGSQDLADIFLLNETNLNGPQTLKFTARRPDGSIAFTTETNVVAAGGNIFGQLLDEAIEFPADAAGMLTLEATLTPANSDEPPLTGTDEVEVIDVAPAPLYQNIAVIESGDEVSNTLSGVFHATPTPFSDVPASNHLDAIVFASKANRTELNETNQQIFKAALDRVHDDGTRLVLWPDNNHAAESFLRELGDLGVVKYDGDVGNLNAPWFGSWNFVRNHWLLSGLPVDCAMDWRWGVSAFNGPGWTKEKPNGSITDGYLMDAPGMETFVGFGADHNTKVGVAGCVIPYGKGQIVFYSLPQLVTGLQPGNTGISPVIAQRLLGNALRPAP